MTNFERIKAMTVEEFAALINDAEDLLQLPPCSPEHCEVWRDDGHCEHAYKEKCIAATVHWLNSEAEEDTEQKGLTENQRDALLQTFLGRGA